MHRALRLPAAARPIGRLVRWTLLLCGGFPVLVGAAEEAWSKVTSAHFTLLSAASPHETMDWAVELEEGLSELATLLPVDPKGRAPLTVILFANDKALQPYKPQINGYPAPSTAYFVLNRSYGLIAMSPREAPQAARRLIYHQGAHWLMGARWGSYPPWFEEGLAELLSSFQLADGSRILGRPINEHVIRLKRDGLMPTEELLGLTRTSPLYDEGHRDSRFYAQAWALTHLLFLEKDNRAAAVLEQYLDAVANGEPPGPAFRRVFGFDYAQMDLRLREYVTAGQYGISRRKVDRAALEKTMTTVPAEKWETELAVGLLHSASGRLDEARATLRAVRDRRPDDPAVNLYLGMVEYDRRDLAAASELFDRVIAVDSQNHRAHYLRAQAKIRLHQQPDGALKDLSPTEARSIADDLLMTISLNFSERQAYYSLAALVPLLRPLTAPDRVALRTGADRWTDDWSLQVSIANIDDKEGRRQEARQRLARLANPKEPIPKKFQDYAHNQLSAWDAAERSDELGKLLQARNYARLRERVDEMLKEGSIPQNERVQWELFRDRAGASEKLDKAEELLGRGERSEAQGLVLDVMAAKNLDLEARGRARALQKRLDSPDR